MVEVGPDAHVPADEPGNHLRLTSCPHCGSRRRAIVETPQGVRGRCLACAADIEGPLEVEVRGRLTLVGRGGQELIVG